jgi:hypothetical protein
MSRVGATNLTLEHRSGLDRFRAVAKLPRQRAQRSCDPGHNRAQNQGKPGERRRTDRHDLAGTPVRSTTRMTWSASENAGHASSPERQPQRDSNPCRHLERGPRLRTASAQRQSRPMQSRGFWSGRSDC